MVRMVYNDRNLVRPRKSGGWTSEPIKPKKEMVFRIEERHSFPTRVLENTDATGAANSSETGSSTSVMKSTMKELEQYCEKTTLHGLRYVGDSTLSIGERIFWFISFSLAIGFAAYYITNIYEKWRSSPVIISFSPFDADLTSIPFPAITICNMNQAKNSEAERILREGSNIEKKLLDDSCNGNATFNDNEHISWEDLRNFLVRVGNSCSDMLKFCQWGSQKLDCEMAFNNDLTDEGLCCSFNRLPPEKIFRNWKDIGILNQTYPSNVYDWNPESGFQHATEDENIVPKRPLGAGAHLGLSVILDAQIDNYYCSSTSSTGFKVILSNPIETPKMADFGFLVSPGFETRISIEPSVREATDSLRGVAIEKRQCYFSNERPLQYYRSYTQRNCNLECQSNHTLKHCSCVPYYLPKNKFIKYCGKTEKECVDQAKEDMEVVYGNGSSCHCLPGCFFLRFSNSKSFAKLSDMGLRAEVGSYSKEYFMDNVAVVQFFFFKSQFTKEVKSELFGFTEILSNVGGLLSLCLGFSFLSLIELLYFVTLRLACELAKKRRTNQKRLHHKGSPIYPFMK
ncbi:pickpocket protein 28-like [Cylas formicarius]|uniref:pickpocket protein 28-like n=1 Tax=Cylas formicarius TaxID=197179 RepID=UPI002958973F|nr:pickpocket protein 28-like [Cylas formicarius]